MTIDQTLEELRRENAKQAMEGIDGEVGDEGNVATLNELKKLAEKMALVRSCVLSNTLIACGCVPSEASMPTIEISPQDRARLAERAANAAATAQQRPHSHGHGHHHHHHHNHSHEHDEQLTHLVRCAGMLRRHNLNWLSQN